MGKKVLILLGDAGGGHMSNAQAIEQAIQAVDSTVETKIVDLSQNARHFPFSATDSFWQSVSKRPLLERLSNLLYRLIDTPIGDMIARKLVVHAGRQDVVRAITAESPDIVISTHFIVSAILERVKSRFPGIRTASVAADLVGFPRMLADRNAELVFAPTSGAAARFKAFGVAEKHIKAPFFPLKLSLGNIQPKEAFKRSLNIPPSHKVILITGGGLGTVSMLPAIDRISGMDSTHFIIVAGKSSHTYELLSQKYAANSNITLLQFVTNIQDYFNVADLIVAKPGPATIVELELLHKKVIFTKTIGMQEHGNVGFLKQNPNFYYLGDNLTNLEAVLLQTLNSPLVEFTPRFGFDSSRRIAKFILSL